MFSKHVTKFLSAYLQHELSTAEAQRVKAHLADCAVCRKECEEIKIGIELANDLQIVPAPASLWPAVSQELTVAHRKISGAEIWKYALAAVVMVFLFIGGWYVTRVGKERNPQGGREVRAPMKEGTGWEVARLSGAPKIGTAPIQSKGELAVGEWLETDSTSRAHLKVAEIGYVDIDENSRVQLVQTKQTEHRISLMKGKLSAFIVAPPRLFFVDTPSATAVDLGCAYTLEVDESGASLLQVTSGWVSLVLHGRESNIPAGAMCATRKGEGVGTPYYADASYRFKAALAKLDFDKEASVEAEMRNLLSAARPRDALTLWHLLGQFDKYSAEIRTQLFQRLASLVPPPAGVSRQGIVRGDQKMLDVWWNEKIR